MTNATKATTRNEQILAQIKNPKATKATTSDKQFAAKLDELSYAIDNIKNPNATQATDVFEAARKKHAEQVAAERNAIITGTAANKRNAPLEAWASEEFDRCIEEPTTDRELVSAIATLASAFYETMDGYDDADGNHINNAHHYQQKMMLDNIVSNAVYMLEGALKRRDTLDETLKKIESLGENSTAPINTIDNTIDMLKRMEKQQIPNLIAYVQTVKAAYYGCRGEHWKPYVKNGADAKSQDRKAALAKIAEYRKGN